MIGGVANCKQINEGIMHASCRLYRHVYLGLHGAGTFYHVPFKATSRVVATVALILHIEFISLFMSFQVYLNKDIYRPTRVVS